MIRNNDIDTVLANSSNQSQARCTILNARKEHVHGKIHILSLKSKFVETKSIILQQK